MHARRGKVTERERKKESEQENKRGKRESECGNERQNARK